MIYVFSLYETETDLKLLRPKRTVELDCPDILAARRLAKKGFNWVEGFMCFCITVKPKPATTYLATVHHVGRPDRVVHAFTTDSIECAAQFGVEMSEQLDIDLEVSLVEIEKNVL